MCSLTTGTASSKADEITLGHRGFQRLPWFPPVGNTGVSCVLSRLQPWKWCLCEIRPLRASSFPREWASALLCVLWESEGFPALLKGSLWASWSNTPLKLFGKRGSVGKCLGTLKRSFKILIHNLCDCLLLVSSLQIFMVLGVAEWKTISVLWRRAEIPN